MESRDNKNKLQKQDPFQGGVTYVEQQQQLEQQQQQQQQWAQQQQ